MEVDSAGSVAFVIDTNEKLKLIYLSQYYLVTNYRMRKLYLRLQPNCNLNMNLLYEH